MYNFANKKKYYRICTLHRLILFRFTCLCSLLLRNWEMSIRKVFEFFQYFATNEKWCQIWLCPIENVWLYFISVVWFHYYQKTKKIWFLKLLIQLNIFWQKKLWRQIWICPMKKCLILFHFHCLGSIQS